MEEAASSSVDADDKHDVHDLAKQGTDLDAQIEKFFDDVLLDDIKQTPLVTMENVLEQRRGRDEQAQRIKDRAHEMLQEELAKEKQDLELRELEAAAAALRDAPTSLRESTKEAGSKEDKGDKGDDNPFRQAPALPFKLEGAGRSKNIKPYVANLTDFEPEAYVKRQLDGLKAENDMLQRCLRDSKNPKAFEGYLRSKATF